MKKYKTTLSQNTVNKIKNWVDGIEINVEELESAYYDRNPYGVEEELVGSSGCWEYDEDEYYEAQCDKAIEYITNDCASAYFDIADDEMDKFEANGANIDEEFIRVIKALKDGVEIVT